MQRQRVILQCFLCVLFRVVGKYTYTDLLSLFPIGEWVFSNGAKFQLQPWHYLYLTTSLPDPSVWCLAVYSDPTPLIGAVSLRDVLMTFDNRNTSLPRIGFTENIGAAGCVGLKAELSAHPPPRHSPPKILSAHPPPRRSPSSSKQHCTRH